MKLSSRSERPAISTPISPLLTDTIVPSKISISWISCVCFSGESVRSLISAISRSTKWLPVRFSTVITSTSLRSCLSICSRIALSPVVTIVIFEKRGSSVSWTVRLEIL